MSRFKSCEIISKKISARGIPLLLHDETLIALLQHYEVRKTPLLDVTQSLRVAASFAMAVGASEGWLYVFGMPHPQGSISHFIDENITLVKLQNVCPPYAFRPHFQEAYIIGRLSLTDEKQAGDSAAYRLLAKYHLMDSGNFWDRDFPRMPDSSLIPPNDPFRDRIVDILGADPAD